MPGNELESVLDPNDNPYMSDAGNSGRAIDLTTTDWWIQQIKDRGNWAPGGVFVIFFGSVSCTGPMAAWLTAAAGLMKPDGSDAFTKILMVMPPGLGDADYKGRLKALIEWTYADAGKPVPTEVHKAVTDTDYILEETDCARILARIEGLPQGSAVGICAAHRLRFRDLHTPSEPGVPTHTGSNVRHVREQDLTFPHLFELLRQLLPIAKSRELGIVLFVERHTMDTGDLPEDLRNHHYLAMCSTSDDPIEKQRFLTKLKADQIRREQGLAVALEFIRTNIPEPTHSAHAAAWVLGTEGLWFEAWNTLKPHLEELRAMNDPNVLLNLALAAAAAGEGAEALVSLQKGMQAGLDTVEQFNAAALVSRDVEAWSMLDDVLHEMRTAFPNHPMTFVQSFRRLMSRGHYAEALEMARHSGNRFEEAWALLHTQQQPDWHTFLLAAKNGGREVDGLARAAMLALDRGEVGKAKEFFKNISVVENHKRIRSEVLLEIVAKEIQFAKSDAEIEAIRTNLNEILQYVALHPEDTDLRTRLVHIFEVSVEDVSRLAVLLNCCLDAFRKVQPLFSKDNASSETSPIRFDDIESKGAVTKDFMLAVRDANQGRPLGRGVIPPNYVSGVSNDVMSGLGVLVFGTTENPDVGGIGTTLQCMNIACRSRNDPTSDFESAIQLLSSLAVHGKVSEALNLAETILLFWPEAPAEYHAARLAHAWSCVAEVYQRSRNPLTALLYLAICFESMVAKPARQHVSMLKQKLRLGARVLRDLKFNESARAFIAQEANLVAAFPERKREYKEVVTTELSCRLQEITPETPVDELRQIVDMAKDLLDDPQETEWGPPVSIGVSLLSIFRGYGLALPQGFRELVLNRISKCAPAVQQLFRRVLLETPTLNDIESAMRELVESNAYDEQGYRFEVVEGLLRRAVKTACVKNDAELFLSAATWLSQPALAAARATWETTGSLPEAKLIHITKLFSKDSEPSGARLRDYALAMERQIDRTESNFKKIAPLPISAAKYIAAADEALCFLVHDSDERLCRLVVRRSGIQGPVRVENEAWQYARLAEWTKRYPEDYSWDQNFGAFGTYDTPSLNDIRLSLEQLEPGIPTDSEEVTVLPEADLFGFTFYLNQKGNHAVGELTKCATAPSLSWLATVRQLPSPKSITVKAWLGHPTLADNAVLRPRGEIKPILAKYGAQMIEVEAPQQEFHGADIAIVLSHGSRGLFRSFVGVNDVGQFTVEELVNTLGECTCVIFFVCNAGRNDLRLFHNETFGLVGRLLRRDVRAVIAPPAPLRNNLPAIWLDPFLQSLSNGNSVGAAHANACGVIRQQFHHPCAWGALQLFGDQSLRFPTGKKEA